MNKKFSGFSRYVNFGPALQSVEVHGFRGIKELELTFNSPITALSGLNGTGKSTIAQLAVCGYRALPAGSARRFYVRSFFPVSAADPEPFGSQQVTVSRKAKEWSGYQRQPERECHYIGAAQFIPKVERQDFSVYGGNQLLLGQKRDMSADTAGHIRNILGLAYEHLSFAEVTHNKRSAELAMATRNGQSYSENHMGFGEGRVVYMVNAMETAPKQSLFVLEEPETSLHGDAQRGLAQYIVDVALRRGHQIIMTTHSRAILEELGRESVVYLRRNPHGSLSATPGLSSYQIDSYLAGQRKTQNGITICVEDSFARHLVIEILRRCDTDLLAGCTVLPVGCGQDVPRAVSLLRDAGLRAAGLVDGDIRSSEDGFVMSLPGTRAPEIEVFTDPAVRSHFADEPYKIALEEVLASTSDHHGYVPAIASCLMEDEAFVATEACRAYAGARSPADFASIDTFLRNKLGDRR
jgi:predicted ATPase